jgi:hypothetical protein
MQSTGRLLARSPGETTVGREGNAHRESGMGIGVDGRDMLEAGKKFAIELASGRLPRRSELLRAFRFGQSTAPMAGDRRVHPMLIERLRFMLISCSFKRLHRGDRGRRWRGVVGCDGVVGEQSKPTTTLPLPQGKPSTGVLWARTTETLRPRGPTLRLSSHIVLVGTALWMQDVQLGF